MKKFKNDLEEILLIINSAFKKLNSDYEKCFAKFTKDVDEEFLRDRAAFLNLEITTNNELKKAFMLLASFCNDSDETCTKCPVNKYCNTYIAKVRNEVPNKSLKMIDLFCGAGGLSLGFTQEGFITRIANDIQECCVDTYAHNHPETPRKHIVLGDIREVVDNIEQLVGTDCIDIVVGGPPCQGFSMANRQRLIDDPRNHLYRDYVEVVKRVKPKFFVMENVKGMLGVAEQVCEDFNNIGYTVSYKILNAKDYGVPQNRERLIYIGNNLGIDNEKIMAEIVESSSLYKPATLQDALFGLRELKASRIKNSTEAGSIETGFKIEKNKVVYINDYIRLINQGRTVDCVFNHKARYNNDRDIEIFSRLDQGDRSDDPKIADIMPYARRNGIFKDKYFKLVNDKVCKTITAHMKFDCNMYIHPTQARGLTPREAARVQSYPDDYFFRGAYTKTYMQIGNSVPPLLGRAIARIIKQYLK